VFEEADLHVYRAFLPDFFDVYFDQDLFQLVTSGRDDAHSYDDDRVGGSRMTVVVDSVSYSRLSHSGQGKPNTCPEKKLPMIYFSTTATTVRDPVTCGHACRDAGATHSAAQVAASSARRGH
jgi:hypothetical protein